VQRRGPHLLCSPQFRLRFGWTCLYRRWRIRQDTKALPPTIMDSLGSANHRQWTFDNIEGRYIYCCDSRILSPLWCRCRVSSNYTGKCVHKIIKTSQISIIYSVAIFPVQAPLPITQTAHPLAFYSFMRVFAGVSGMSFFAAILTPYPPIRFGVLPSEVLSFKTGYYIVFRRIS
jgi:hypothetical protein